MVYGKVESFHKPKSSPAKTKCLPSIQSLFPVSFKYELTLSNISQQTGI